MLIMIKRTEQIVKLDGVPCRAWKGVTAQGTNCVVFVHRICTDNPDELDKLASEGDLQIMPPPNFEPIPELLK